MEDDRLHAGILVSDVLGIKRENEKPKLLLVSSTVCVCSF